MILIISIQNDHSTDLVCQYLNLWNISFLRINLEDEIGIEQILFSKKKVSVKLIYKESIFDFKSIKKIWFRNGHFFNVFIQRIKLANSQKLEKVFLLAEIKIINDFIFSFIEKMSCFGSFSLGSPNKLEILALAQSFNLNIPETLVTDRVENGINFINGYDKIITKPLSEAIQVNGNKKFTKQIDIELLKEKLEFSPVLLQQYIVPICELRIFVFNYNFYTLAIVNTENSDTKIKDWRYFDLHRTNRYSSFNLPVSLKKRICNLMKAMMINCASIDLILASDYKYYFLEINPVGQYYFIGRLTNSPIEKEIALYLSDLCHAESNKTKQIRNTIACTKKKSVYKNKEKYFSLTNTFYKNISRMVTQYQNQ
ncbi:MAG: hypothetical protein Q8K64_10055 [Sediminibacterium sp.]|nr:hypothetical protein [Sediminibacterium sp.]TXT28695.1 MAG: hypothetical protein FD136_1964 [Chitinophagaceae bacterium]